MYNVQSSAERATSQMQGAAGTMSAMTKKQGTKTKQPEPGAGQYAMTGLGGVMMADAVGDTDIAQMAWDKISGKGTNDSGVSAESTPTTPAEKFIFPEESSTTVSSYGMAPDSALAVDGGASAMQQNGVAGLGAHLTDGMTPLSAMETAPAMTAESTVPAAMEAAPVVTAQTGSQLATGGALAAEGALGGATTGGAAVAGTAGLSTAMGAGGIGAGSAIGSEAISGLGSGLLGAAETAAATTAGTTAATTAATTAGGIGAGSAIGGEAIAGLSAGIYGGGVAAGGAAAGAGSGATAGSAAGPWGTVIGAGIGLVGGFLFS